MAILSSTYHVDRFKEMFSRLGELAGREDEEFLRAWEYFQREKSLQVAFIGAEMVLPERSRRFAPGAI